MTGHQVLLIVLAVQAGLIGLIELIGRRFERRAWAAFDAAVRRDRQSRGDAAWGEPAASSRTHPAGEPPFPASGPQAPPPGGTAAGAPEPPLWVSAAASHGRTIRG